MELKLTVAEEPVEDTGDKRQLSKALQEKAQMIDLEAEIRVKLTKNQRKIVEKMKYLIARGFKVYLVLGRRRLLRSLLLSWV